MKSEPEQHNWLYRYLKLWYDTIQYIRLNGWAEYRKARERYDRHKEAEDAKKYKYTKVGEIKRNKQIIKDSRNKK